MTVLLRDGKSTLISIPGTGVEFEEIEVTPPEISGGGAIPLTTMRSSRLRPKWPKQLADTGSCEILVAYSPALYDIIMANKQVVQAMLILFPDSTTLPFFGWIEGFKPNPLKEGERPTAMLKLELTNTNGTSNPANAGTVATMATSGGGGDFDGNDEFSGGGGDF